MNCLKCYKLIVEKTIYGLHINCYHEWFNLTEPQTRFNKLDPKKADSSSNYSSIKKNKNTFYHGRYRKYSAQLDSTQYILKIQEEEFPELPAIEYICNKMATLLNLKVPDYYLIKFDTDEDNQNIDSAQGLMTFVTRNFMQDHKGTFNHIYKFLPRNSHSYNCKNIIQVIQQQTGKLADVERFVEICLFDALIGNNDRHGRNLGIIDTGANKQLAPMYDNPSFLGTEKDALMGAHFNPSGSIWTSCSKEPKVLDYIQEFQKLGLKKSCLNFIKKVKNQFPKLIEEVEISQISQRRKKAFTNLLKNRLKDFENV